MRNLEARLIRPAQEQRQRVVQGEHDATSSVPKADPSLSAGSERIAVMNNAVTLARLAYHLGVFWLVAGEGPAGEPSILMSLPLPRGECRSL